MIFSLLVGVHSFEFTSSTSLGQDHLRQLVALNTFSDMLQEVREKVVADASAASLPIDSMPLNNGSTGINAYADAIVTYLAFAIDKAADYENSICTWNDVNENISHLFTKQAIQVAWDFVEANPIEGGLSFDKITNGIAESLETLISSSSGTCEQADATNPFVDLMNPVISTDPPYYDNISYADLSDFFYVWIRHSLSNIYPDLFGTLLVPKAQELIASSYRFAGDKVKAQKFFEEGFAKAFTKMRE